MVQLGGLRALLGALALALGCQGPQPIIAAQVVSDLAPASLDGFYIPTHKGDRGVGEFIADDLRARGKQVRTGTDGSPPPGTRVLVVYDDSWMWDLTMYLLLLRIEFRDAETNLLLATGSSSRPSVVRAEPEAMVRETLEGIFRGGVLAFPDLVIEEEEE